MARKGKQKWRDAAPKPQKARKPRHSAAGGDSMWEWDDENYRRDNVRGMPDGSERWRGAGYDYGTHGRNPAYVPPQPPPPPLDPALVAATEALLVEFRLNTPLAADTTAPGLLSTLTKQMTYVRDGQAIWLLKRTPVGFATSKVAPMPTAAPHVLREGFVPAYPRVPWSMLTQVVSWFRDVNKLHKTEAYVQIWIDLDRRVQVEGVRGPVTQECMFFHVPIQDVSGGMVDHIGEFDKDPSGRYIHLMDIHSHHTMGAFWSSTDDGDEKRFERLYGVVGTIDKPVPTFKWRTTVNGKFIDLGMSEVIDIPDEPLPFTVSLAGLLGAGTADLSKVAVDPFSGANFPPEWNDSLITRGSVRGMVGFHGTAGAARGGLPETAGVLKVVTKASPTPFMLLAKNATGEPVKHMIYCDTDKVWWERVALPGGAIVDRRLEGKDLDAMMMKGKAAQDKGAAKDSATPSPGGNGVH